MNIIEYAALIVIVGVIAALLMVIFEPKQQKGLRAEDLGYMPGSENPPWGWPIAIALGLAAFGLLLFGPTMAARWLL